MAYVSQEKKAHIAAALREFVPAGWRYSLAIQGGSMLVMTVAQSPVDFLGKLRLSGARNPAERRASVLAAQADGHRVVDLAPERLADIFDGLDPEVLAILECIRVALNFDNHDRSDSMVDYFDVGHYVTFQIGKWNKPYRLTAASDRTVERTEETEEADSGQAAGDAMDPDEPHAADAPRG